jgi:UDP-glucose 4-epimerase
VNPGARFYAASVGTEEIRKVIQAERPEIINHHAAQMDVRRSVTDPLFDATVIILGLIRVMETARECGVKKIIFASSGGAIYGDSQMLPTSEEGPERPQSPYGISKLASEHYLRYYRDVYRIPYIALRYANVYGPRQNPRGEAGVVAIFCLKLLEGDAPVVNGNGAQTRDYVYVGDVVRANLLALHSDYVGAMNIGTGVETDVNTLFERLKRKIGSTVDRRHGPPKPGEQERSVLSSNLAHRILKWDAEVSLDEGLDLTVKSLRKDRGPSRAADGSG